MAVNERGNIFVTFGAGRRGWIGAAKRITTEAEKTGLFEFCFNLDENWLKTWDSKVYEVGLNLRKSQPPRGFGYWTWKPSVLLWAHLNFPNRQIVYVDAGSEFRFTRVELDNLHAALLWALTNRGLAFSLPGFPEEKWTKRDVIEKLSVPGHHLHSDQVQSGFLVLPPILERIDLLSKWRSLALENNGFYFTDEVLLSNSDQFIENRHDQSILSCLWKEINLSSKNDLTDPSVYSDFGLVALRNNSILSSHSPRGFRLLFKYLNLIFDKIASLSKLY
jgi:hypothetical protein